MLKLIFIFLFYLDIDTDNLEADKDNLEEEFVEYLVKEDITLLE
jgi:hypothetical protein